LDFFKFLYAIVLSRLMSPLNKDETQCDSSLTLTISHYTVITTMFMYFCVWFSWPWGWLQMWPKHIMWVPWTRTKRIAIAHSLWW